MDGRTRLPGRFTIDFVKVDDAGRTTRGDADLVADALGDGAEALAVADATVAATRDSMAEVTRVSERRKHPQDEAAGNFVSLDLGDGRFAVYEHLKPGSIRVRPGQRVRRGEVVAQLGFTGDSTGPHLHLHVGDAASPLGAEGLPFVFDRVDVLGRYPDIAAMGKTRWSAGGRRAPHQRTSWLEYRRRVRVTARPRLGRFPVPVPCSPVPCCPCSLFPVPCSLVPC